ncbi:MAG: hypothetical protein CM15mP111_5030 [Hyphomicrobiales bacterium]|nr:MAG: hypothetical protein CM15mP111_5030 [Hyphomicrobiales bacterium]
MGIPHQRVRLEIPIKQKKWEMGGACRGEHKQLLGKNFFGYRRPELIKKPKFSNNANRIVHVKELGRYISDWMSSIASKRYPKFLHKESGAKGPCLKYPRYNGKKSTHNSGKR